MLLNNAFFPRQKILIMYRVPLYLNQIRGRQFFGFSQKSRNLKFFDPDFWIFKNFIKNRAFS